MKTNNLMRRQFFDTHVNQRTKDGYFNSTDLLKFYNDANNKKKRFKDFWENKQTKDFLEELAIELNGENHAHLKTIIESDLYTTGRGRGGATWMHPYLFVKFAMWLSAEFEVKVIKWVYDNLIDFRNQVGDYYKDMCKSICSTYSDYYKKSPSPLVYVTEARFLNKLVLGAHESGKRNELNEKQLDLLNNLQKINISLIDKSTKKETRYKILRDYACNYKIANF